MKTLLESKLTLHLCWLLISSVIIGLDHLSGPYVRFPILFIFPVALATWFNGRTVGISYAAVLPVLRFWLEMDASKSWPLGISGINSAIQIATLVGSALLIDYTVRTTTEVRLLEGLLPICARCKKIRDKEGAWVLVEAYVADRSDVTFTHSYCPDCIKQMWDQYHSQGGATKQT